MNTFITNSKGGPDFLRKSVIESSRSIVDLKILLRDKTIIKVAALPFFESSIDLKVSGIFDKRKLERYERDFVELFKEQDENTFFVFDRYMPDEKAKVIFELNGAVFAPKTPIFRTQGKILTEYPEKIIEDKKNGEDGPFSDIRAYGALVKKLLDPFIEGIFVAGMFYPGGMDKIVGNVSQMLRQNGREDVFVAVSRLLAKSVEDLKKEA